MAFRTSSASNNPDSGERERYKYDHSITRNLAIGPVKTKTITEPSHKASSFREIMDRMSLEPEVKTLALKIFSVVSHTGALIPYVNYYDGGLLITWDNNSTDQHRILYIFIHPKHSVRYQIGKRAVVDNDYTWKFITDSDKIFSMVNYLGHYLEGTIEEEPTV